MKHVLVFLALLIMPKSKEIIYQNFITPTQYPIIKQSETIIEFQTLLNLINEERQKRAKNPLTISNDLSVSAMERAREIKVKFSHERIDGSDFETAISIPWNKAGENIALASDQEEVYYRWMNSRGHEANLMDSAFNQIGIGFSEGAWVVILTN